MIVWMKMISLTLLLLLLLLCITSLFVNPVDSSKASERRRLVEQSGRKSAFPDYNNPATLKSIKPLNSQPPRGLRSASGNSRFLRLLALDGGGIRGIISSQVLVFLEELLRNKTSNPSAKIGDFFDLFAGTSAGGIMSLALLNGYSASQISDMWLECGPLIFGRRMKQWMGPAVDSAYNPQGLEECLRKQLGNDTRMSSFYNKSFAIVSFDIGNYSSAVFTRAVCESAGDFLAWQVGRATSAAPTYFPTAVISSLSAPPRNFTMVDGGVMANNPSGIGLSVAAQDFPGWSVRETVLLSLGTGITDVTINGVKDWGYEPWYLHGDIMDLIFNGPMYAAGDAVSRTFQQLGVEEQYARIQYNQNSGHPDLEDCESADFALDNATPKNMQQLMQCGQQLASYFEDTLSEIADMLIA